MTDIWYNHILKIALRGIMGNQGKFTKKQSCKTIFIFKFPFSTCTNPIIHLFYPQKICICIALDFSWDISMSQEKWQIIIKTLHFSDM